FEGIDGSGKSTQCRLLCQQLKDKGVDFKNIVFPQYEEPSSALLKMYLNGVFGSDPSSVNAYAASTFFAVDRYASYKLVWGKYYEEGGLIITDRYTTSNAVHQAAKVPPDERADFYRWLYDFEFNKMGLPAPDAVLYFDISLESSVSQLRHREAETGVKADIHEGDNTHLLNSLMSAREAAKIYGWKTINCMENGLMRSIESINREVREIYNKL
ncbi:MAG: thymidylate kinase, partial [Papillibacter sp.]|nr:thymidylate kinase [Papillibacter sp.]